MLDRLPPSERAEVVNPYDYLVWLMRGVSALFLASGAVRFERFVVEL